MRTIQFWMHVVNISLRSDNLLLMMLYNFSLWNSTQTADFSDFFNPSWKTNWVHGRLEVLNCDIIYKTLEKLVLQIFSGRNSIGKHFELLLCVFVQQLCVCVCVKENKFVINLNVQQLSSEAMYFVIDAIESQAPKLRLIYIELLFESSL